MVLMYNLLFHNKSLIEKKTSLVDSGIRALQIVDQHMKVLKEAIIIVRHLTCRLSPKFKGKILIKTKVSMTEM